MSWVFLQYKGAFDALWTECDEAMKDAIRPRLAQVRLRGNQVGYPITEPLGDGLFEVRARYKKVRIRVLFGFAPGQKILVVWGGTKDQRRLPPETIKRARTLLAEAQASIEVLHVAHFH
jgi:hypothetical protein